LCKDDSIVEPFRQELPVTVDAPVQDVGTRLRPKGTVSVPQRLPQVPSLVERAVKDVRRLRLVRLDSDSATVLGRMSWGSWGERICVQFGVDDRGGTLIRLAAAPLLRMSFTDDGRGVRDLRELGDAIIAAAHDDSVPDWDPRRNELVPYFSRTAILSFALALAAVIVQLVYFDTRLVLLAYFVGAFPIYGIQLSAIAIARCRLGERGLGLAVFATVVAALALAGLVISLIFGGWTSFGAQ
jgi:hypothetical protein